MLIKVIYRDEKHDMVKPYLLDALLESGKVKMFHRSDGWAIIGFSTLRNRKKLFDGKNKRLSKNSLSGIDDANLLEIKGSGALKPADQKKQNCWEFMNCGREIGGMNISEFGICPAATLKNLDGIHSGKHAGRACWVVAGTMCHGEPQGTFAKKTKSCGKCPFYRLVSNEEESRVTTILLLEMAEAEDIFTLELS